MAAAANIVYWNARSLRPKVDELIAFMTEHNTPIALINETHLKKELTITGYNVYQNNRQDEEKGGTAIIVSSEIQHHSITLPALEILECTAIKVNIHKKDVILVAAYNRPTVSNIKDIKKVLNTSTPIIVAGDLNAKHTSWLCHQNNKQGRELYNLSNKSNFVIQAPTTPTFYHSSGLYRPGILDITLVQNFAHQLSFEVHDKLDSDHLPVIMKIHSTLTKENKQHRMYHKANWDSYRNTIDTHINPNKPLNSNQDIEDATSHLTKLIKDSIQQHVPMSSNKNKNTKLPTPILQLIKQRNQLRKLNRRFNHNVIKAKINKLREDISSKIKSHNNKIWHDKVSKLSTGDNSAWRVTKALTRQNVKIPPLKHNNVYICDPEKKAELLADTLQESFTPNNAKPEHQDHKTATEEEVKNNMNMPHQNKPKKYRPSQIRNLLKKLKKRKAPGPDEIPNEALSNLPDSAVKLLTNIINASLRLGYFPEQWKLAKVLMFPKPGKDHSDPNNYRPISLLCTLSKVAEKAILMRLNKFLNFKKTIRDEQFGFRSQHSTAHQVTRVTDDIIQARNKNQATAMLLIDLQKAFDRVWHDGLISKLIHLNVPNYIIRVLHSYLSRRSFYVQVNESKSNTKPILAGVPQGSLLGPVLFNIYINDIPNDPNTSLAIYADDTAVQASSLSAVKAYQLVQRHANSIADWCNKWLLQVNASKCETILFCSNKKKYKIQFTLKFNGEDVKQVRVAKYLGVTLDWKLNWNAHLNATRAKASARLAQLYPLLNPGSSIQTKTALHIYKATILPVITYASPAWSGTNNNQLKELQKIQNKVLKIITKCPMYTRIVKLHKDLQMPMVNEVLHNLNKKFYAKANEHTNKLIANFANCDSSVWDKVARPKFASQKLLGLNFYH
jgi:endonuclease/exonuclease/phosphatase family metal-dependent hydrolase